MKRLLGGQPGVFASRLDKKGQATVEYLIVGVALLAMILGIGALGKRVQEGLFVEYAIESASHAVSKKTMGTIGDVLLY